MASGDLDEPDRWPPEPYYQKAAFIFKELINGSIGAAAAATETTKAYNPWLRERKGDRCSWPLREVFCNYVRHSDAFTRKVLLEYVECLSKEPDVRDDRGELIQDFGTRSQYWRDLPIFGSAFRDVALVCEPQDPSGKQYILDFGTMDQDLPEAPNLNGTTFAALYFQATNNPNAQDMAFYIGFDLSKALEMTLVRETNIQEAALIFPHALIWIEISGRAIYNLCKTAYQERWACPGLEEEWLWAGKPEEFNIERWILWKARFSLLAEETVFSSALRSGAARAADCMETIENHQSLERESTD